MRFLRFFDAVYADNAARSLAERRSRIPDWLRYARNTVLRPLDDCLAARDRRHARPIVFVVGAPRSGTTLLYQLRARHLEVAYICNEIARYWSAPLVGARLARGRHGSQRPQALFRSRFGRDPDAFGPHEFSWFWHYWGDFREHDDLRDAELSQVDWTAIAKRLSALAGYYRSPLVVKSINFTDYQVETLAERLPDARFLWIQREPLYCAQSILEVRRSRYGDPALWWSVRPRDHHDWQDRAPAEQVVHQIRDIEHALERSAAVLPPERFRRITYEQVVDTPARMLYELADWLGTEIVDGPDLEALAFKNRNDVTVAPETLAALEHALEEGFDHEGSAS